MTNFFCKLNMTRLRHTMSALCYSHSFYVCSTALFPSANVSGICYNLIANSILFLRKRHHLTTLCFLQLPMQNVVLLCSYQNHNMRVCKLLFFVRTYLHICHCDEKKADERDSRSREHVWHVQSRPRSLGALSFPATLWVLALRVAFLTSQRLPYIESTSCSIWMELRSW